jgi:hypothetical protein
MLDSKYIALSFEGLIGLVVTIISVWLVVRQLREAKLASQMEGLLLLVEQLAVLADQRESLMEFVSHQDWASLTDEEAHARVYASEEHKIAYKKTKNFYEVVAVLVKRKALDKGMAADYFGKSVGIWHQRLLKITQHESKMLGYDVGAQWEWLGKELGG